MSNVISFINNNLILSVSFVLLIIIYCSFEIFNYFSKDQTVRKISVAQLISLFNNNNAIVIDLRSEDQYNLGHIVNSINIPQELCHVDNKIIKNHFKNPIIVVDENGKSSAICSDKLNNAGIKEVFYLQDGLNSWRSENMPLVKNPPKLNIVANTIKKFHHSNNNKNKIKKIVIYTKKDCSYCEKAKQLLTNKGISYQEIIVKNLEGNEFKDLVNLAGGNKTTPQIFIEGKYIGGFDDIKKLNDKGELDQILTLEKTT